MFEVEHRQGVSQYNQKEHQSACFGNMSRSKQQLDNAFHATEIQHLANDHRTFGLFSGYTLSDRQDLYGKSGQLDATESIQIEENQGVSVDKVKIAIWVLQQFAMYPHLRKAKTVMLTSFDKDLKELDYWKHTSRFLVQRTQWKGPAGDNWFFLFVPAQEFNSHFCWIIVFVAEIIAALLPESDIILIDPDAKHCPL